VSKSPKQQLQCKVNCGGLGTYVSTRKLGQNKSNDCGIDVIANTRGASDCSVAKCRALLEHQVHSELLSVTVKYHVRPLGHPTINMKGSLRPSSVQLLSRGIRTRTLLSATSSSSAPQFSTTNRIPENRILDPVRIPPNFHNYLQHASASNILLLLLFSTSACASCRVITPLLEDLVKSRGQQPSDKFQGLNFAEVELDSPDNSNGNMMDLGVEFGVTSMPTLMGFGGRRAERITDRVVDTNMMGDRRRMEAWVDEVMRKGDPSGTGSGGGGGGLLSKLFG
jgi:thiol-disulfide isomerase/thioredoxin